MWTISFFFLCLLYALHQLHPAALGSGVAKGPRPLVGGQYLLGGGGLYFPNWTPGAPKPEGPLHGPDGKNDLRVTGEEEKDFKNLAVPFKNVLFLFCFYLVNFSLAMLNPGRILEEEMTR